MKRTGIFALAASCAIGVTALVGGVGYASALDVAEQTGKTLDVSGVSTVESSTTHVADSTTVTPSTEPTDEATDAATPAPVVDDTTGTTTDDDGTADQGSGDVVDEVDPSAPVVIKDDGDKNCRSDNAGERVKRSADREAWLAAEKAKHDAEQAAEDATVDPNTGDKNWGDKSWGDKDWGDGNRGDGGWGHDDRGSDGGRGDSGDRGGWGGRDGGHRGGGGHDGGQRGGGRH